MLTHILNELNAPSCLINILMSKERRMEKEKSILDNKINVS
ncbi:hypothetical protein THOG11_20065 [Vibrio harveyi]|nr:hypothetical protein THOG11_20065 [Vibrio harveyi]